MDKIMFVLEKLLEDAEKEEEPKEDKSNMKDKLLKFAQGEG
jgi:hypothetical protein